MDKVVHFEIPVDDPARAKEFYGSIFDWDPGRLGHGRRRDLHECPHRGDRRQPATYGARRDQRRPDEPNIRHARAG